jgi:uncharacterized protein (DUF58 family)
MRIDRELFRDISNLKFATPGAATGLRQGERRSPFRGRGVEFADYRPYSPGDDLRLVDWNIYARLQTVLVRLFHEDRNLSLHVHLDASASMDFGSPNKAEHGANLTACLALLGLLRRDSVSVGISGARAPKAVVKGENTKIFTQILDALERTQPDGVAAPWRRLRAQLTQKPDRLCLISDMLYEDDDVEMMLRTAAGSARFPVLLHVLSEVELNPPLDDPMEALDAETGQVMFVKSGRNAQKLYQQHLRAWLDKLQTRCRALNIVYVSAYNTIPTRELLQDTLTRRRVITSLSGGAI